LEKVNHELDQFVYSASHNLRAPLLSMKGLLHLAEQDETSAATRKQFIGEAFKSIERLDATIKDIIDYSKNARLELVPVLIDWTNLIQSTFNDLRFYEQRPIALELKIADSGNFLSDEKRLKSIVHNIISNSIKYNDSSKEKSWMQVTISCNSETCDCTFTDNGIGIPLQNQERVFDMFYRATSAGSGSGLGLYIAKEMIERIGGKIQLQSTPGVGTDIQITLPNLRH
jgi:signal transduction histidine kinase